MDHVPAVLPAHRAQTQIENICDTHNHVFGPFDRFPLQHPPEFPMPLATIETYLEVLDRTGPGRGVLVQPTQQGCDNTDLLHALDLAGDRLRAVGGLRSGATDETFGKLDRAGVRALRFVEAPLPDGSPRPGAVEFAEIPGLASRLAACNWAVDVWAPLPRLIASLDVIMQNDIPVIFEHMGMLDVRSGVTDRHFQTMLGLVREGRIHVKLSVCRCSTEAPEYEDLRPFHDALVEANPDQLVWGSDWPFIRMDGNEPDPAKLLDLFCNWTDDAGLQRKILVDNPERLYGFRERA
ncbi:MAG: amidohydrolase family protein [Gammaproteobacteria bacterium]|nr:amidohydrolase family protein [Gammaproteobacteria bacterium]MYH46283.1 amidohydrolase family protein [Gammaproteobacteria bacterium]MYL13898.1 amidohydrolase family protein [Gammaproteobacteria bacterium]